MSSLLRASDYFDNNNRSPNNVYWNELIKAIDEFDELI